VKPVPTPSFLDSCEPMGARGGRKRWRRQDLKRIYTWDEIHGEIEVFNERGHHVGVLDGRTGKMIKPAVPGRRIDV
jgi:putative cytotoxic protein